MWAWRLKRLAALLGIVVIAVVAWIVIKPAADEATTSAPSQSRPVSTAGAGATPAPDETTPAEGETPSPPEEGGSGSGVPSDYSEVHDVTEGYWTICAHPGDRVRFAVTSTGTTPEQITLGLASAVTAEASDRHPALFDVTAPASAGVFQVARASTGSAIGDLTVDAPPCPGF
jgi:hypothetical protein